MTLYNFGRTWAPVGKECLPLPKVGPTMGKGIVQKVRRAAGPDSIPGVYYPIPINLNLWHANQGVILKRQRPIFYGDLRLFGLSQNW